jgi:hypothetical protein
MRGQGSVVFMRILHRRLSSHAPRVDPDANGTPTIKIVESHNRVAFVCRLPHGSVWRAHFAVLRRRVRVTSPATSVQPPLRNGSRAATDDVRAVNRR